MESEDARRRNSGKALPVNAILAFLLIFSLLSSSAIALPLSRSLKSLQGAPPIIADSSAQVKLRALGGYVEDGGGRKLLLFETNDYDGTGANNKHDPIPRSP